VNSVSGVRIPVSPHIYNMETEKINAGHYLELMDRLHVIMCNLNDHCLEHTLTESDEVIKTKIDTALKELWDAYQIVGSKSIDYENENNTYK